MKIRLVFLTLALWLLCAAAVARPLVIILVPGTSLSDWTRADAPHLRQVMRTGALAVMNTRTARLPNDHRREPSESAALTLGAGSRAAGGSEDTDFQPQTARAPGLAVTNGALFSRRTGLFPAPGSSVNVEWPRVLRENAGQGYDLRPGNLGDGLRAHGIAIMAGGGPMAFPVACTSDGQVVTVPVGSLPSPLPDCLVWDAGADLGAADAVIGQAMARVAAARGRLIVLSPAVGDHDYAAGRRLAPVVIWGPDVPAGLIVSPSTHRAGLVTNTDFAPTVTADFGDDRALWLPSAAFGHSWTTKAAPNSLAAVARLEQQSYSQSSAMRILPSVAVALGILVLASFVMPRCAAAAIGSVAIILGLAVSGSIWVFATLAAALAAIGIAFAGKFGPPKVLFVGAALLFMTLAGDMAVGDPLMRLSLLGYSAVEGARYYGMGNEAMGALVGAALVTSSVLWPISRRMRLFILAALLLTALLLGSPLAGAKAGGLLVAVAAFGAFGWTAMGRRLTRRTALLLTGTMLLALALASVGDFLHRGGPQSHLGQAVGRIRVGGIGEAADIVSRKLAVEIRLLYHSAWAVPLWASVYGFVFWKRIGATFGKYAPRSLFWGGTAAVVMCLTVNDAGVVAAALCGVLIYSGLNVLQTEKGPHGEPRP